MSISPWLLALTSSMNLATPWPWWDFSGRVTANFAVTAAQAEPDSVAASRPTNRVVRIFMECLLGWNRTERLVLAPPPGGHGHQFGEQDQSDQQRDQRQQERRDAARGLR